MTTTIEGRAVERLPWTLFEGAPGVRFKVLWRDPGGSSYAGMLSMQPGTTLPPHTHETATHHVWVAEGSCRVLDADLDEGSYASVAPGTEHGVTAGTLGCVLFYLYLRPDR